MRLVDAGRAGTRDLDDIWRRLVQSTGRVGRKLGPLVSDGPIMTAGPVLAARYERFGIPRERADAIARVVADEAAAAMGEKFSLFTVLQARTYRMSGLAAEASAILRKSFADDVMKQDWDRMGRSYLYELALAEAALGHLLETIAMAGLSMADIRRMGPVTYTDAKIALVEIGDACLKMDEAQLVPRYANLLRSAVVMSPTVTPKWDQITRARFKTFGERADELGLPECKLAQGFDWFAEALATAAGELHDPELEMIWKRLVPDGRPPQPHPAQAHGRRPGPLPRQPVPDLVGEGNVCLVVGMPPTARRLSGRIRPTGRPARSRRAAVRAPKVFAELVLVGKSPEATRRQSGPGQPGPPQPRSRPPPRPATRRAGVWGFRSPRTWPQARSAARHEGDQPVVVHSGGPWIGVTSGDLGHRAEDPRPPGRTR